ncbi:MAG: guanylate kinase [Butyrivibrio sp.]|nr:guanylate kinase [Butyrivibrio sp.]
MSKKGVLAVISGFSGAGKGTIVKELIKRYPEYALSVSMTTRDPRPGEEHGREYFFVSDEEFEKLIEEDGLIEHAGYCKHYYGTPRKFVDDCMQQGRDVILEIEMQGALQVRKMFPDALLLFVTPPTATELEKRLRGRNTESEEVIKARLSRAYEETEYIPEYDYLLVNDDLDKCVEMTHTIIRNAHEEISRNGEFLKDIKTQLEVYK